MSKINTYSVTIKVEEENLAVSMGSGSLCVLATPCLLYTSPSPRDTR